MGTVIGKHFVKTYALERPEPTKKAMKFQSVAALAVLSTKANANWGKITDLIVQLEEAAYNKTVADDPTAANDRGFQPTFLAALVDIQYYGCWCYLDADWDTAKGPVQDGLDQECKNLVQNYRCLVLDALDRGETCDPASTDYVSYNLFGANLNLTLDCTTNGNEDGDVDTTRCRQDLCIADGEFSLNLFSLMFQQGGIAASQPPYDPAVAHANNAGGSSLGLFDPATDCKYAYQGAGRSEKECCGNYPTRFPYKTYNGDKACCGDKTYSTISNQCCDPFSFDNFSIEDINDSCPT